MLGGFMRKEPLNSSKLHEHPEVVALFTRETGYPSLTEFGDMMRRLLKNF